MNYRTELLEGVVRLILNFTSTNKIHHQPWNSRPFIKHAYTFFHWLIRQPIVDLGQINFFYFKSLLYNLDLLIWKKRQKSFSRVFWRHVVSTVHKTGGRQHYSIMLSDVWRVA